MINCNIVSDLLPVYLENTCTADTKNFVEEHVGICENCRKLLEGINKENDTENTVLCEDDKIITEIINRVQKRRTRTAFIIVAVVAVITLMLGLIVSATIHLRHSMNPTVYEVEDGVCNLTAGDITVDSENVFEYVLFTNYAQISVTVNCEDNFEGIVYLYNCDYPDDFVMLSQVNNKDNSVLFTGLSSSYRYYVDYSGDEDVELILSESRTVSFWNSLKTVVSEILGL